MLRWATTGLMSITLGLFRRFKRSRCVSHLSTVNSLVSDVTSQICNMASVCANRSLSSSGFSIPYQRARAFPVSKGVSRRVQQDRASQWFPFSDASGTRPYLSTARCVTEEASFVASSRWRVKKIESDEELLVFLQIVLQGYFEVRSHTFSHLMAKLMYSPLLVGCFRAIIRDTSNLLCERNSNKKWID